MNIRTKREYSLTHRIRSVAIGLFLCAIVLCTLTGGAAAQSNPTCFVNVGWCNVCGDPVVPGAYDCTTETVFFIDCKLAAVCPPYAIETGCNC
jgi:hypothetical protein